MTGVQHAGPLSTLFGLWKQLPSKRKRQLFSLMGLMTVSTVAEVASLGALLPFLSVLAAPEKVFEYSIGTFFADLLGADTPQDLAFPLTLFFCGTAVAASGCRILLVWSSARLSYAIGHDLSVEVYRRSLYQPYIVHTSRHSSEIVSAITKVKIATGTLYSLLGFVSAAMTATFILIALFVIDPLVMLFTLLGLTFVYLVSTTLSRRRLQTYGQQVATQHTKRMRTLQEGLGAIRDVLLNGDQLVYSKMFRQANLKLSQAQSRIIFLTQGPRFVAEGIGMVAIAVVAYVLSLRVGGFAASVPILGALAMGAQRLLPSMQQIYNAWATIKAGHASLADVLTLVQQEISEEFTAPSSEAFEFHETIEFRKLDFSYADDSKPVLKALSLQILKGARVGFVGATGSGKSTVVDLLMGLLEPTEGEILIDGRPLTIANRRSWQRNIAHVPQSIYLTDGTLAENIAFGVPADLIDMERVEQAALAAQISDLEEIGPKGLLGLVGERGIRLSGGQRQRIGIARALYKQASVLVFDEATSALDGQTEKIVMEAVKRLDKTKTVILIAHRLSTLRECDIIFILDSGSVSDSGTYDDLIVKNNNFRLLASEGAA